MGFLKGTKAKVKVLSSIILMVTLLSSSNVFAQEVNESTAENAAVTPRLYSANSKDYVDIYMYAGSAKVDVWVAVSGNYGTAGMDSTQVCDMRIDGYCYDETGYEHVLYGGADQVYSYSTWARSITMRQITEFKVDVSVSSDDGSNAGNLIFDFNYGSHTFS